MTDTTPEHDDATLDDVDDLLREAEASVAAAGDQPPDDLREVAEVAAELVADSEPGDLLEAVGGDVSADAPPETIPEALSRSDPDAVSELRKLLVLSKAADDWEDGPEDHLEELRELIGDGAVGAEGIDDVQEPDDTQESDDVDPDDVDPDDIDPDDAKRDAESVDDTEPDDTEPDDTEPDDGSRTDDAVEPEGGNGEAADADAEAADADGSGAIEARLSETLTGYVSEFREEIETILKEVSATDDGAEGDEETSGDGPGERSRAGGWTQRRTTAYSTLPSSNRRDVGQSSRFSTLRASEQDRRE